VPNTTSIATGQIALLEVIATLGAFAAAWGSKVINPRKIGDGFDTAQGENDTDEGNPVLLKLA